MPECVLKVCVYLGSLPEQSYIWNGAKVLAITALLKKGITLDFEEISSETLVKKLKYTETEFATCLGSSHIHIFVDHPNQGSVRNL